MVSKAKSEAVAKAKQFYNEEMAKKQGAGKKSSIPTKTSGSSKSNSLPQAHPHPQPISVATKQKQSTAPKKLKPTKKPKVANINKKQRADDIKNKAWQYYKDEMERKAKNRVELRRSNSHKLAEQQYFEDASDDLPLLVNEGEREINAHRQFMTYNDGNVEPARAGSENPPLKHVSPWTVGSVVLLVALALQFVEPLATTFGSIVALLQHIAWQLLLAASLVAAAGAGIYLTVRQVRTMCRNRQIQFRRDALEVKTRVYEILRADPDTGVTVASLREELMVDMKRGTFDKIWAKITTDINADNRVAKFFGGYGMDGCEEEVWQWHVPPSHNHAVQSRLRRVVFNTTTTTNNNK